MYTECVNYYVQHKQSSIQKQMQTTTAMILRKKHFSLKFYVNKIKSFSALKPRRFVFVRFTKM